MGKQHSDLVRYSRDGDQFHYLWAARRCLKLLHPSNDTVCITIEGIAQNESASSVNDGADEIVDVAEYSGSSKLEEAKAVTYFQLKHSTQRLDKHWVLSELENTLKGFLERYLAAKDQIKNQEKLRFVFLTNRPFSSDLKEFFQAASDNALLEKHKKQWEQVKKYLSAAGTSDEAVISFFRFFEIQDVNEGLWQQRNLLQEDFREYLPGADGSGPSQLWRLVSEKATSLHSSSPEITKYDVLRVLNSSEKDMFPAQCLIKNCDHSFQREQEDAIFAQVLSANVPVIIHADGGVGKSVLAYRLANLTHENSVAVLFDCFGNGTYRNTIGHRHGHEIALTQIVNELAGMGLCHPLIPDSTSRPANYLKAFKYRLEQASTILKARDAEAKLLIFVDAADNAQMAAEENNETDSFARDLIRLSPPDNIILVFLTRTHRIHFLKPPSEYLDIPLNPFSISETKRLLLSYFDQATEHDVEEFHRLSSRNPRIQATALASSQELESILSLLGPEPTTVEQTIQNIFQASLQKISDGIPEVETKQLTVFCEALASLTPFIPIQVLATATNIPQSAIRSFVADIGRPISLVGDAVQFTDEPSETWLRETYRPDQNGLRKFISAISPLASENSYVASTLPQLMLQAGNYEDLIGSVLNDADLPADNAIDRRHISLKRAQFALKAAISTGRLEDAAKIAFKAASETAGDERQHQLFRNNSDIVSQFLPSLQLRELVSSSTFSTSWHGGRYAYDAALLSGSKDTKAEGRGYLRVAQRWLRNWSQLSSSERDGVEIQDEDIVQIAFAQLNIHGEEACIREISRWSPRAVRFRVTETLVGRLVDLGRFEQIRQLESYSANQQCIQLALVAALSSVGHYSGLIVSKDAYQALLRYRRSIKKVRSNFSYKNELLALVNTVAQAATHHDLAPQVEIAELLSYYLPDMNDAFFGRHQEEGNFVLIRGFCLNAALNGQKLELEDLAKPEIKEELRKDHNSHLAEVRDFRSVVGEVFSWHQLWSNLLVGSIDKEDLDSEIEKCRNETRAFERSYYTQERQSPAQISRLWLEILILSEASDEQFEEFEKWRKGIEGSLYANTLTELARISSRSRAFQVAAYTYASEAYSRIDSERMDAEQKVDSYCALARAVYSADKKEANFYFEKAIEVAGKTGDENLQRWESLLILAEASASASEPQPKLAYQLSRMAELTYEYVVRDKHFSWDRSIRAITKLCPKSAPAILSRWWDRRFAVRGHLFPSMTEELASSNNLDSISRASFIGFSYRWDHVELIQNALNEATDLEHKKIVFTSLEQYARLLDLSSKQKGRLNKLAVDLGVGVAGTNSSRSRAERDEQKGTGSAFAKSYSSKELEIAETIDWDAIFEGLDFQSYQSLAASYERSEGSETRISTEAFCKEYFRRAPITEAGRATEALFSLPDLSIYAISDIFATIPEKWLQMRHYKDVLQNAVKIICKRHYLEIKKSDYYQFLPWDFLIKHAEYTEADVFGLVLKEFSFHSNVMSTSQLFGLVDIISTNLSQAEARRSLDFGLESLSSELDENDGDGRWRDELRPPSTVQESLAGYIWSRLGAPENGERWEAAHTVCLLAKFRCNEILMPLARLAEKKLVFAFNDPKLPFYEYSAQLWLLYALSRTCKSNPEPLKTFENFLTCAAEPNRRHVLIRGKAAAILISLYENEIIKLQPDELERLSSINSSKLPISRSEPYSRQLSNDLDENREYFFAHDFDRYWYERLGRIFCLSPGNIQSRATRVILDDWKIQDSGSWKSDPRSKLYRDSETRHSHSETPKTEPLNFYRSFHSLMFVAGDLIDTVQRHQDPEELKDEFEGWLERKGPTRDDDSWLFDRRDPCPSDENVDWKDTSPDDEWPFSVQKTHLEKAMFPTLDTICLWGNWTNAYGDRSERINVSSALVTPSHASSLLRALQTTVNPHDYCIPWESSNLKISDGSFVLRPWVSVPEHDLGIDEMDPWSGKISFPAIQPAKWFCDQFELEADEGKRTWFMRRDHGNELFSARTWQEQGVPDYYEAERGKRLTGQLSRFTPLLKDLEMDLIIEVQMHRDFSDKSHRKNDQDSFDFIYPYTLLMIVRSNGEVEKL